jgi:hypothetical protein
VRFVRAKTEVFEHSTFDAHHPGSVADFGTGERIPVPVSYVIAITVPVSAVIDITVPVSAVIAVTVAVAVSTVIAVTVAVSIASVAGAIGPGIRVVATRVLPASSRGDEERDDAET